MRFSQLKAAASLVAMATAVVILSGCVTDRPYADPKACYEEDDWYYGAVIDEISYDGPDPLMVTQILGYLNTQFWESTYFGIENDLNSTGAFDTDGEDRLTFSMFTGPSDSSCSRVDLYVSVHPRGADRDKLMRKFEGFQRIKAVLEESLIEAPKAETR